MSAPRPIDFSIPAGRIGAPKRKGHAGNHDDVIEKQRAVLNDGDLRVKVTGGDSGPQEIAFPADGSVNSLFETVASVVGGDCACKLLLNGALLSEHSGGATNEADKDKFLASMGATPGCTLLAICSKKEEILVVKEGDEGLNKFDGRRTFDQEVELEKRREHAKPMYARKAEGSLQDYSVGFSNITPLEADPDTGRRYTNPVPAEALKLLEKLAYDPGIQAVMKKYRWRVGLLTELPPSLETGLMGVSDHCLLGLNVNKGQEIKLRLRTSDLKGFRKYLSIKETLIHELTHMVHSEHDAKFWSLFRVLMREADDMDWTKSTGRALGEGRSNHSAADSSEEGAHNGHLLGNGRSNEDGSSAALASSGMAAVAAQRRAVEQGKRGGEAGGDCQRKQELGHEGRAEGRPHDEQCACSSAGQQAAQEHTEHSRAAVDASEHAEGWDEEAARGAVGRSAAPPPQVEAEPEDTARVERGREDSAAAQEAGHEGAPDPLAELEGLGFGKDAAQVALQRFKGSVARAADWLLSGGIAAPGVGEAESGGDSSRAAAGGAEEASEAGNGSVVAEAAGGGFSARDAATDSPELRQLKERMENAVQRFVGGVAPRWADARTGLSTLVGMIDRILQSPGEEKFRRVRLSNSAFVTKIARHAGGKELLLAANFRHSADGEALEATQREDTENLRVARAVLQSALEALP